MGGRGGSRDGRVTWCVWVTWCVGRVCPREVCVAITPAQQCPYMEGGTPPVPIYGEEACPCLGPAPQALQTLLIGPRPAEAPPRPALFESGVEKARLEAVLGAGGRGFMSLGGA